MSEQASSKPTQAVAPVTETPNTTTTAPQQDNERFAQLARKEKALRMQAKQIQEQKAAWEAEKSKYVQPSSLKDKFLKNPQSLGLSYEDIAQAYLNQPTPENQKFQALQQEIENLKNGQQQVLSQAEQASKKAYETAVKQLTREVGMLVDGDEAYETIKATSNQEAVVALIEETYKEDGVLMTAEEAAKQIEEYLLEEAVKLSSLKKVQSRLKPAIEEASTEQAPQKQVPAQQQQQTKTLTNAIVQASKPLSGREKRERAILAFQGKLS